MSRYTIVVQPVKPWPIDEHRRLRAALKALLRSYGLRVLQCSPLGMVPDSQKPASLLLSDTKVYPTCTTAGNKAAVENCQELVSDR